MDPIELGGMGPDPWNGPFPDPAFGGAPTGKEDAWPMPAGPAELGGTTDEATQRCYQSGFFPPTEVEF